RHGDGGAASTVFVRQCGIDSAWCSRTFQASERERTMKALVLTTALLMACGSAYADSCKVEAGNKKLAGAAMTSFMKKCETDAKTACAKSAADKKLAG